MTRRTKVIIAIAGLAVVVGVVFARTGPTQTLQTESVRVQSLSRTVLATGAVTSSVDLDLSFKGSGIVRRIPVRVGQKVVEGTILMQLEQGEQLAGLAQARASIASAKANLEKVLSGATNEETQVAQAAVDGAQTTLGNAQKSLLDSQKQQQVLVNNAKSALYNTGLAVASVGSAATTVATISGSYTGQANATYAIAMYQSAAGLRYESQGPEALSGNVVVGVPLVFTQRGLYIQFSQSPAVNDAWTVEVPNTKASGYVTYLNAYTAALETQRSVVVAAENAVATAQAGVDQAVASLNLKKAMARPADVQAARAQLLSAEAQLSSATSQLENTIIRAPASGTVTRIDIKIGEQATAMKPVVMVQDVGNLYVEANISEANIAQITAGQVVTYTFDALGPDKIVSGTVTTIDPASTVVSGVVNYKVTASVSEAGQVKPGMTANMSILVGTQDGALAVPQRSIVEKDAKKYVRVITNAKKQVYREVEVKTGLEADGGLVEVVSGLSEGQIIVTFIEAKK